MTDNNSETMRLLFDGMRLILQAVVEYRLPHLPKEMRDEIQDWYDRCYRMLENHEPPGEE